MKKFLVKVFDKSNNDLIYQLITEKVEDTFIFFDDTITKVTTFESDETDTNN